MVAFAKNHSVVHPHPASGHFLPEGEGITSERILAQAASSEVETGNSDLDIPCSIFVIQTAGEKPISNTEQGMSKDEVPGPLSQRERAGERESAWLLQKNIREFSPSSGLRPPSP
ncbi:MAG: hypothetical protein ACI8QI_000961 [Limisphaerales bacterium]|jgi:hypothetical protein